MQIYKGMDIGTAKATADERARVPHHLIDFLDPRESYSVERYRDAAIASARDIVSRGRLPILVGGTGLYVSALTRTSAVVSPKSDPEYRERILSSLKTEEDRDTLWQRLLSVDPESAEKIHKNNVKRVIRALEIYDKTGKPKSLLDRETQDGKSEISVGMITVDFHDRELLYSRVDSRVDVMLREGLIEEVEGLYKNGLLLPDTTAAQAIGYKEIVGYLRGERTLDSAVEEIKLSTRRYAKRQLTWFRHTEGAKVIYADREAGGLKSLSELTEEAIQISYVLIESDNKYIK